MFRSTREHFNKITFRLSILIFGLLLSGDVQAQIKMFIADSMKYPNKFFVPFYKDGSWQYLHTSGNIIVDSSSQTDDQYNILVFHKVARSNDPSSSGAFLEKKYLAGVIDSNGHEIVPIVYDSVTTQRKNDWAMMDLGSFDFDYYLAWKEGEPTVFDSVGKIVKLPRHIEIRTLAPGVVAFSRKPLFSKTAKWGWFNIYSKKIIQRPRYDSVAYKRFQPDASTILPIFGDIQIFKNGKKGVQHINGNKIAKPKYQEVFYLCYKTGLMRYTFDEKTDLWGLLNTKGKVISKPVYQKIDRVALNDNRPIGFFRNGKLGYIDPESGKEIVPPIYDSLYGFPTPIGNRIPVIKDEKMTLLDWNGKTILPLQKHFHYLFTPQKAKLTLRNKHSFTIAYLESGSSWNEFSKPFYRFIAYSEKYKWGIKDWNGKTMISAKYDSLDQIYRDGKWFFLISQKEKWGLIDEFGKIIIPLAYEKIMLPSPNYHRITDTKDYIKGDLYEKTILALKTTEQKQNATAIYDISGRKLISEEEGFFVWDDSENAKDWLTDKVLRLHRKDTTTALLNTISGKLITPLFPDGKKGTTMYAAADDRFVVIRKAEEGYLHSQLIDATGNILFQSEGMLEGNFRDGYLTFTKNMPEEDSGLDEFIDRDGRIKSFPKYNKVYPFLNGVAIANLVEIDEDAAAYPDLENDIRVLIDTEGNELSAPYLEIESITEDNTLFQVRTEDDQTGLIDGTGKEIIPTEYNSLVFYGPPFFWPTLAWDGDWWYYLKPYGEKLPIKSKVYLPSW